MLRNCVRYGLSVYSGISPALLATISMGAHIQADSQPALVSALRKNGIVRSDAVAQTLEELDRKWFTDDPQCYNNKPSPISNKENMTDVFTHALTLQAIDDHLQSPASNKSAQLRVLDIGCGHGYLSFGLWRLAQLKGWQPTVLGLDIHKQCIEKSQTIQQQHFSSSIESVKFETGDVNGRDSKFLQQPYDLIHCGFFVAEGLHQHLVNSLTDGWMGVWPISDSNEQRLHLFTKINSAIKKNYLVSTLFSQQRKLLSEQTQKYFVEFDNILNEPFEPPKPAPIRNIPNPRAVEKTQALKHTTCQFKLWQQQFKKENGRAPTLEEIRSNPQAAKLLESISRKR